MPATVASAVGGRSRIVIRYACPADGPALARLEGLTGRSLGTYMQENIFSPLGMTSTSYKLTPETEGRRVSVHQRGADGKFPTVCTP